MSKSTCGICKLVVSKYKCPICSIKYCSVGCWKTHKSSPDCVRPSPQENIENHPPAYQFETEDTVKPEMLEHLRHNSEVLELLKSEQLRKMLKHLNSSENPDESMEKAMNEPLFHEFSVGCLKVVAPDPKSNLQAF